MEQKDIQRYFGDLKFRLSLYEKAKKEMDTYIASDFNVFEYIQPKENRLSEIIADLLDVKGKHGQKDTFLKQFIKQLGIEFAHKLENCQIKREDGTIYIVNNKREIDIENKLIGLNYKVDMVMWLENCYKVCEAEKIRFFIKDFMIYIKQNFENIDEEMKGNENE